MKDYENDILFAFLLIGFIILSFVYMQAIGGIIGNF